MKSFQPVLVKLLFTKSLLFLSIILFSLTRVDAQTNKGLIEGIIQDEKRAPMVFANILLLVSQDSTFIKGTISDEKGAYRFEQIPPGSYLLSGSMVGYPPVFSEKFNITETNSSLKISPLVLAGATQLSEVQVISTRPLFEKKADRTIINVENSVINAGSDAWEIIQRAPGLTVDNNDQISILGKTGTIVLIDGKRTFLSGEALASFLRSTPSNNIDKIEIITNPSAKYDASGNAGIINIVNKKNIVTGFNTNLSLNAGAGWNAFINPGINLNYKGEKFNVSGNYSYTNRDSRLELGLIRRIQNEDQNVIFDQENTVVTNSLEHLFGFGIDYNITPKHIIGINFRGFERDDSDDGLSASTITSSASTQQLLQVGNESLGGLSNYSIAFSYEGKLNKKGSSLYLETNYIRYDIGDDEQYAVSISDIRNNQIISEENIRNLEDSDINIASYQLDFTHPFSQSFNLNAGVKISDVSTSNILDFSNLDNEVWVTDEERSSQFDYDEQVTAGYLSLTKTIGKVKINGGLRIEHTESIGNSINANDIVDRSYTDYFPSISINYGISQRENLGLSYSRRIDRPRYQDLNPFLFFIDPFTFVQGNPILQPQYTNNFELSYRKKSWQFSVGYSNTEDVITFITQQDDPMLTGVATNVNFENLFNYNGTISYQNQLFKWWRMFSSVSLFYNEYKADLEGAPVNNSKLSLRINTSNTFILPKGFKVELSGFYQSPAASGISENKRFYILNAGLQKRLLKKINARFTFVDVMNSSRARGVTQFQNQNLDYSFRRTNSRFVLSLSYLLGNEKIKVSKRKTSGASAEDKRVITN